jgi:hypothetical protein
VPDARLPTLVDACASGGHRAGSLIGWVIYLIARHCAAVTNAALVTFAGLAVEVGHPAALGCRFAQDSRLASVSAIVRVGLAMAAHLAHLIAGDCAAPVEGLHAFGHVRLLFPLSRLDRDGVRMVSWRYRLLSSGRAVVCHRLMQIVHNLLFGNEVFGFAILGMVVAVVLHRITPFVCINARFDVSNRDRISNLHIRPNV